jgi:3'-phosphoadenosine 5'-phosphosulfate sulfotransferase (PAPS reductase)/FAD synthetase
MKHVVLLSGGKDSTAMAIRLQEVEPREYTYLITPTGNELPEMEDHWKKLETILDSPLVRVGNRTLMGIIIEQNMIPNWRARFCTRMLKIEPYKAWLLDNMPVTGYVGLRADEGEREGIE